MRRKACSGGCRRRERPLSGPGTSGVECTEQEARLQLEDVKKAAAAERSRVERKSVGVWEQLVTVRTRRGARGKSVRLVRCAPPSESGPQLRSVRALFSRSELRRA